MIAPTLTAPTLAAPVSMVVPTLNTGLVLNEINYYQMILLLITATFSHCLLVTGSCKGTITSL